MKDNRNVAFIRHNPGDVVIEFSAANRFTPRAQRVRRRITDREAVNLIEACDYIGIDII